MADEHNENTENNDNTSGQNGGDSTVTMTQEKLNSLINGKFAKGAESANKQLLESIGVDDIDVLKSIVTTHRESEEASKSELQKLQDLLDAERIVNTDLESKLNTTITETEIQNIAIANGINPEKMKYFKMDYLEAKQVEGFELEKFISGLKEKQPDFFGFVDERVPKNIPNPPNRSAPSTQIKMVDYVQLPAAERKKYKSSDLIR
jgi:hypothetical protein